MAMVGCPNCPSVPPAGPGLFGHQCQLLWALCVVLPKQRVLGYSNWTKRIPLGGMLDPTCSAHQAQMAVCGHCVRWGQGSATGAHSHHCWFAQSCKCWGAILVTNGAHKVVLPLLDPTCGPHQAQMAVCGHCVCWGQVGVPQFLSLFWEISPQLPDII